MNAPYDYWTTLQGYDKDKIHLNNISVTINKKKNNRSFHFFLLPGLQFQDQQLTIIISLIVLVCLLHRNSSRLFLMKGSDEISDVKC